MIPVPVAEELAASSPNGRVEALECGHLPNWERPDELNAILGSFLASL